MPEADDSSDPIAEGPWFIFNDFVVRNISEQDALSFPGTWKVCLRFTVSAVCQFYFL